MFGDLDWPLNASREFVSISWASCCIPVAELIVKPANKSVTAGEDTWLNCSTNVHIPVNWYKNTKNGTKLVLYTLDEIHEKFRQRFNVSPALHGRYNLIIRNVHLSDDGWYECKDRAGIGESATAHVSVTEITFQQTTGTQPDVLHFTCQLYADISMQHLHCSVLCQCAPPRPVM